MRIAVSIIRIIVGLLFIISGLVKANDPLGLSYKMQEFFEIWNLGLSNSNFFLRTPLIGLFQFLHEHSLALSVIMIGLEIMAGVALLLGWRKRFVLNSLLLLIIFFTFLTAYAFLSGKFKNCGCFGDCLPITPLTSFLKDVALCVFIVFLIIGQRYITPLFSRKTEMTLLIASLLVSIGTQWYVLNYLPFVDCLPFKKGNNIAQQMKIPAGALPDSFAIRFIYEKEGKKYEFSPETFPADLGSYKYVDRIDKLVRKGNAEPPIKGFGLAGLTADSTAQVLTMPNAILLICEDVAANASWMKELKNVQVAGVEKGAPLYVVTSASIPAVSNALQKNGLQNVQTFNCDNTAVRTAARTNPTLYILKQGTILNKYSYRQLGKAVADIKKL